MSDESVSIKPLPPIGVFLSEGWANYKGKFSMIVQIALVPAIIQIIVSSVPFFNTEVIKASVQMGNYKLLLPLILLGVAYGIISYLAVIGLFLLANDQTVGGSVGMYYKRAKEKFFAYLWVSILAGLTSMAALCLFIFPVVIVGVWVSLATCVLINENIGGIAALIKSRNYVRNYWWGVFGRFLVMILVIMGISFCINICLIPLKLLASSLNMPMLSVVTNVVSVFLSLILDKTLALVFIITMYRQLRQVKGEVTDYVLDQKTKKLFIGLMVLGLISGLILAVAVPVLVHNFLVGREYRSDINTQVSGQGFTVEP